MRADTPKMPNGTLYSGDKGDAMTPSTVLIGLQCKGEFAGIVGTLSTAGGLGDEIVRAMCY